MSASKASGPLARPAPAELSPAELLARALRLLGRREHSRRELERKLTRLCGSSEIVEQILDRLQSSGKLSESRLVEQTLAVRGRRYGRLKLQHELRAKGVSDAQIDAGLQQSREQEVQNATEVWRRKFGQLPKSLQEKARQVRFLQQRGFTPDVIYKILSIKD